MKKSTFLMFTMVAVMSVAFLSCKKTPAPTAEISATIDGYTVTFTAKVTDVDTYLWDFDDDGETSTEAKPVYTYAMSGTYNVTLTVKGEGGEATATYEITLEASFLEMLTGGVAAVNGKTWVLSKVASAGEDGSGAVTSDMTIDPPQYNDNFLVTNGLGAEYDNEFTFKADGSYSVNPKNDTVLAGMVYSYNEGIMLGDPAYDISMCAASYTALPGATWTLHSEALNVDAIIDPTTSDIPPEHHVVTFTNKTWISIQGAYFGILDYSTTAMFIIKEIKTDKMKVALFLCGYGYGDNLDDMMLPTNLIHVTFVPKSAK
jgi:PKD repeat protein